MKKKDQILLERAYLKVLTEQPIEPQQKQDMNSALLNYLNQHVNQVKHYKKFAKVKAHQSKGGEQIQTKLDGRNETEVRTTNPGDWVVSNVESQGEQQIVDDKTFQKRYDAANPKEDIYSPKGANFFGVVYDGSLGDNITFAPPNWGGSTMNITKGYMIGGPDPKNFGADFYGIDPTAFQKTYKPAEMVQENLTDNSANFETLLQPLTSDKSKQQIISILQQHPDWVQGLKNFQEKDPQGYKMSLVNFNTNGVRDHLIQKMSQGKSIGYYDFM